MAPPSERASERRHRRRHRPRTRRVLGSARLAGLLARYNDSCVFHRASMLSLTIEDCVEYIALICSAVAAFRSQRSEKWKPGLTAHGGGESVWQQTRNCREN